MKFKRILAILASICLVVNLSACSDDNGKENDQQVTVEPEEMVSITVYNEWTGSHPFTSYFNERLENFKLEHPEIDVNVEEIAGTSTANMDAKLKVLISSGELPDVFYTNDKSIIDLAIKSDLLNDMKEELDSDVELMSNLDMADIAAWNEGTNHVYAISSHKDFFGYFYNTEMLNEAGYDSFPQTWEDMDMLSEKLKESGKATMSLETKTGWFSSTTLLALLASQNEAGEKMANTLGVTDYNTPEFIAAASELQKMFMNYTTADAPGSDITVALNNFANANTAMVLDGAWRIGEFTSSDIIGSKVDVALLPGNGAVSYPGFAWFSGSKDEKKAAAAYQFIKWMNNKEDQTSKLRMLGLIPASQNVDYSTLELPELMVKILEMRKDVDYSVLSPWRVYPATVIAIIPQELSALAIGQNTPEQFAENLTNASK